MVPRKSSLTYLIVTSLFVAGCSSTNPPQPPKLDDSVRVRLNQHLQSDPQMSKRFTHMRISLGQVIESYLPADVHVYVEENVNLGLMLSYDNSRPWTESLGAALADAGIGMVADLDKKIVLLNALPTTLGQILERNLPTDFKVYLDSDVDRTKAVNFDTQRPWLDALRQSVSGAGYDLIANLDKKIILIRPIPPAAPAQKKVTIVQTLKQLNQPEQADFQTNQDPK